MKAPVDQETCMACSVCAEGCPEVFHLNDEGKAFAILDVVSQALEDATRKTSEDCPAEAISLE